MSTKSTWTPKPPKVRSELRPGRAVRRERGDDPVAGPDERRERGVDGGHPRGEGDAGLAAGQLRVGAPRARPSSGSRCGCRRTRRAVGGDPSELVGVGRGERGGLVDRDAGRRLVDLRRARCGADGARREASWRPVGVGGSVSLTERCYTGVAGRPAGGCRDAGDAVLAGPLRGVHRAVGADDQLVRGPAVVGIADDADRQRRLAAADRQLDGHRVDAEPDLLGQDEGAGRIGLGQEHHELVAAVAGGGVDLADAEGDDLADAAQDTVAVEVAEPVVDRLELVEIHHQQAEAAARAGAAGDLALDRGEEEGPVEQAGQRVDRRQPDRRVARPALGPGDDHRHVRQQDQGRQVDADRGRGRRAERARCEPATTART